MSENKKFEWTDELVKEFMLSYNKVDKLITGVDPIIQTMQEWKSSKQPYKGVGFEILKCMGGTGTLHKYNPFLCLGKDKTVVECKIHSVRRIEDNEVFSVGDEVKHYLGGVNSITSFTVHNNQLRVNHELVNSYSFLQNIQKIKEPIPLFTTVDGKDIYEGCEYWKTTVLEGCWKCDKTTAKKRKYPPPSYFKCFSTKENCEEYILMNKPVLSVNDFLSCCLNKDESYWLNNEQYLKVKELAKQKINGL